MSTEETIHSAYDLPIGPELAAEWLKKNSRNRPVSKSTVDRFAYAMENDMWHYDGAPIRRDPELNLLDGQHRLSAVVKSGKTFVFHVIDGIDPKTQATMDTGRKRSLADALHMNGEKQSKVQAAIVNAAYRWYVLNIRSQVVFGGAGQYGGGNVQMEELVEFQGLFRPDFEFAAEWADSIRRVLPVPSRVIGLLAWIIVQRDRKMAEEFLEALLTGAGLEKGSPILAYRNILITRKGEMSAQSALSVLSLGIRAWNLYRLKKTIVKLYVPTEIPEAR